MLLMNSVLFSFCCHHTINTYIFISLTGVKAYVARRIKVRGDLVLAQRLEKLFEKAGGREVYYFLYTGLSLLLLCTAK